MTAAAERQAYGPQIREKAQSLAQKAARILTQVEQAQKIFSGARPSKDACAEEPLHESFGESVLADLGRAMARLNEAAEGLDRLYSDLGGVAGEPGGQPG